MSKALVGALCLGLAASAAAGDIRIVTEPVGAEVLLGSTPIGVTTKTGLMIAAPYNGIVTFTIRKEGFLSEDKTVKVEAAGTATVVVRLRPLRTDAPIAQPATPLQPPEPTPRPPSQPTKPPVAYKPAPVPTPEAKGGGHKGLVLGILGAAGAGTAVAVVVAHHKGSCPNITDPSVSPGGGFTINVVPDLTGQVNCNTPTQNITITGTNLDCSPVTIASASVSASLTSGACVGGTFTRNLGVAASTVAPGGKNVIIAQGAIGHTLAGCCLNGGACGSSSFQCDESEVYTVQTSKGPITSSNQYVISFPTGFSCVPCDPSSASCRGPARAGMR